ncbi:hypothetical protein PsorP6_000142 [Peronosclerospora sorghi]|uniref:Uncharacterized protein n=1 Tax=Peronosclerospora sorghi TaxID=230839 RepID=A0ACC0WXM5_9STRA|nr:hypothetical protein PsorP6_000142 [Peronosclerospora sorghi]
MRGCRGNSPFDAISKTHRKSINVRCSLPLNSSVYFFIFSKLDVKKCCKVCMYRTLSATSFMPKYGEQRLYGPNANFPFFSIPKKIPIQVLWTNVDQVTRCSSPLGGQELKDWQILSLGKSLRRRFHHQRDEPRRQVRCGKVVARDFVRKERTAALGKRAASEPAAAADRKRRVQSRVANDMKKWHPEPKLNTLKLVKKRLNRCPAIQELLAAFDPGVVERSRNCWEILQLNADCWGVQQCPSMPHGCAHRKSPRMSIARHIVVSYPRPSMHSQLDVYRFCVPVARPLSPPQSQPSSTLPRLLSERLIVISLEWHVYSLSPILDTSKSKKPSTLPSRVKTTALTVYLQLLQQRNAICSLVGAFSANDPASFNLWVFIVNGVQSVVTVEPPTGVLET